MDNIDLSLFSDADLDALDKGDLSKLSDEGLAMLETAKAPKGPTTRGGARRPVAPTPPPPEPVGRGNLPLLPRDPRMQTNVDLRRGVSTALGVPGGVVETAAGLTGFVGAEDTSRALQDIERRIAQQAPSKEAYAVGKMIPAVVPYGLAAKAVSKLPLASRFAQGAAQVLGQAGTAYAVTPDRAPTFEDLVTERAKEEGMFGLGPRGEAALTAGALTAAFEAAPAVISAGRAGYQRGKDFLSGLLKTTGPRGATPQEEAALEITAGMREGRPEVSAAQSEVAAARQAEQEAFRKQQELKEKYLADQQDRIARRAKLDEQKAQAQAAQVATKSEADKAAQDAASEARALNEQTKEKVREARDQSQSVEKVLEETNVREASEDAKATLEDRAAGFRDLADRLKREADEAAAVTVEPPPIRDKQSRAVQFRDLILGRRERLKGERNEAIGVIVDPVTGEKSAAPFLDTALKKEAQGESISDTDAFGKLVKFAKERSSDVSRYGAPVRSAYKKFLSELQPLAEDGKTTLPIRFEKLLEERRLIAEGRPGQTEFGYEAIEGKRREEALKAIDDALDSFGEGYKQFNKTFSEKSRPLDEFEFGVGKAATEKRKFSRDTFEKNPEVVLDTALTSPSRSSAQSLKANFFDEANHGDLENIVLEEMLDRASKKGYDKVLGTYGEFLEEFPQAKQTLLSEAERVGAATSAAEKTAAFKQRWADRVAKRADAAEKAINSISGLQGQIKTSLTSPLKEGALEDISSFVRSNPQMRDKVGAALTDVLKSFKDSLVLNALRVPERQAAFMRAGMTREQIESVIQDAQQATAARASKVSEIRDLRTKTQEARKKAVETQQAGKAAVEAEKEKVRKLGAEYKGLSAEAKAQEAEKAKATAEFGVARALRVSAQQKQRALGQLTPDMRDAINIAAEKIPLNTTAGLAKAVAAAGVAGGLGTVVGGSPIAGILASAGTMATYGRKVMALKTQQKAIADEIENIVKEILRDETGGVAGAIEKKISRAEDVMKAQRVANQAMTRLGFKPDKNAISAAIVYNAYAKDSEE